MTNVFLNDFCPRHLMKACHCSRILYLGTFLHTRACQSYLMKCLKISSSKCSSPQWEPQMNHVHNLPDPNAFDTKNRCCHCYCYKWLEAESCIPVRTVEVWSSRDRRVKRLHDNTIEASSRQSPFQSRFDIKDARSSKKLDQDEMMRSQ